MGTSESKVIVPSFDAFIPPEMAITAEKVGLHEAAPWAGKVPSL